MIQTTEVWVIKCDKCGQPYGKNFQSKYYMIQEATKLGGWIANDKIAICKGCQNDRVQDSI